MGGAGVGVGGCVGWGGAGGRSPLRSTAESSVDSHYNPFFNTFTRILSQRVELGAYWDIFLRFMNINFHDTEPDVSTNTFKRNLKRQCFDHHVEQTPRNMNIVLAQVSAPPDDVMIRDALALYVQHFEWV